MKTNEIALGTLKQGQVRDSIELAIRFSVREQQPKHYISLPVKKALSLLLMRLRSLVRFLGLKAGCGFITTCMSFSQKTRKSFLGMI